MWGNPLTGPVPPELGNLSRLADLNLAGAVDNDLEGPIPPEIGKLALGRLSIFSDKLTGPIPSELGNLHGLTWLILGGKNLTGPVPSTFINLTSLKIVRISLCMPGTPDWLPWAARIESLGASFCNESDVEALSVFHEGTGGPDWTNNDGWGQGSISEWYGVKTDSIGSVVGLELSNNGLTGRLPSNLGQLEELTELVVDGNELSGPLPLSLTSRGLTKLHYADTDLCALADDVFREWLASIEFLEGTGEECEISERDVLEALYAGTGGASWIRNENWSSDRPLGEWVGVTVDADGRVSDVLLPSNGLLGPVPVELGTLTNLRRIDLANNKLSGAIPTLLANLSQAENLRLDGNELSGPIPPELGTLAQLTVLDLGDNELTGSIPPRTGRSHEGEVAHPQREPAHGLDSIRTGKLREVRQLDLDNNGLTGSIPSELGNLPEIDILRLGRNELAGPIPTWLGRVTSLVELYLNDNDFTGPVPGELQNLTDLRGLNLQNNRLTGQIPTWLGGIASLESLRLASNDLDGPIPPELGNLTSLRQLVVWGNGLTGSLPPELANLGNLRTLSVSETELTGPIPAEFTRMTLEPPPANPTLDPDRAPCSPVPLLPHLRQLTIVPHSKRRDLTRSS